MFFDDCKHSSWKSSNLMCLDTSPLESLDSILFLSHLRIYRRVEVKNRWRNEGEIAT